MAANPLSTASADAIPSRQQQQWHGGFVAAGMLDVLVRRGGPMPEVGDGTGWGVAPMHCSSLEARLLAAGALTADAFLGSSKTNGVRVRVIAEPAVLLFLERRNDDDGDNVMATIGLPLTRAEVRALHSSVRAVFGKSPQPFDYGDLLTGVIGACAGAACRLVPDVFTPARLEAYHTHTAKYDGEFPADVRTTGGPIQVRVVPNCPIGGDMMAYDYCFETAPSHRRISYPDFNALSEDHHRFWFRHDNECDQDPPSRIAALHLVYIMEALTVPAHEVVHVLQGAARQTDSSIDSMSAEHDASVAAASLAYHVAKTDPAMRDVLGGGAWEAAVLLYERHEAGWLALSARDAELFADIGENFGCGITQRADANPARSLEAVSKATLIAGLLAYDNLHTTAEGLAAQLRCVFEHGRCDADTAVTPPSDGVRSHERLLRARDVDHAFTRRNRCTMAELKAVAALANAANVALV